MPYITIILLNLIQFISLPWSKYLLYALVKSVSEFH